MISTICVCIQNVFNLTENYTTVATTTTEFSLIMQWRLLLVRQAIGKECEVMYIMYKLNIPIHYVYQFLLLNRNNYYLHIVQMNWISLKNIHTAKKQTCYIMFRIFSISSIDFGIYKWQRFVWAERVI